MKLESHNLEVLVPEGWEARIYQLDTIEAATSGGADLPVVHAANFALPEDRGDYGSGAVEIMGSSDVFVSLLEFEAALATEPLYARTNMPRFLDPDDFRSNGMQRWVQGQAAYQAFFNEQGRAFCLYIVIGSHLRRAALAKEAEKLLLHIRIVNPLPPGIS